MGSRAASAGKDNDRRKANAKDLERAEDFTKSMRAVAMEMDAFDNDRNRSLDFREFSKLVREREMAIHTEEALRKRFKAMEADGSGEIEMAEFIKYALKDALQRSSARVVDLLREWDEDGSGEIEKGEFVKVVRHLGFDALESEVNAVFDELDFNQSGSLEIRELKQKLNEVVREEAAEGDKDYGVLKKTTRAGLTGTGRCALGRSQFPPAPPGRRGHAHGGVQRKAFSASFQVILKRTAHSRSACTGLTRGVARVNQNDASISELRLIWSLMSRIFTR